MERYKADQNKESFIDFFWTFRFTHLPIFKMLPRELPRAKVYHTISTGYAGLLGVIARVMTGRPLLLTEHGIYVKERKIEISQAEWVYRKEDDRMRIESKLGAFQTFWIRMFEQLGKLCYDYSSAYILFMREIGSSKFKRVLTRTKSESFPMESVLIIFSALRLRTTTIWDKLNLLLALWEGLFPLRM